MANVLFSAELARRYKDKHITSVSLHPGVIDTGISSPTTGMLGRVVLFFARMFPKEPREGAKTTIYCATDEDIPNKSGLYFNDDSRVKEPSNHAKDLGLASKLWDVSAKLVGL